MKERYTLPYVRFARRQDTAFSGDIVLRAYDHRLFYCTDGGGTIEIEGVEYRLRKGSLLIWRSGLEYRFTDFESIKTIALNFDITSENLHLSTPIPPSAKKNFEIERMLEEAAFPFELPNILLIEGKEEVCPMVKRIMDEFSVKRIGYEAICSAELLEILAICGRHSQTEVNDRRNIMPEEILNYIRKNLESELTYESIGEVFHYHPNHINRILKRQTGMTFHNYVRSCRAERAIDLLESTDIPVGEIAQRLRFADLKSFSRCFKLSTGHTPTYYRYSKE